MISRTSAIRIDSFKKYFMEWSKTTSVSIQT